MTRKFSFWTNFTNVKFADKKSANYEGCLYSVCKLSLFLKSKVNRKQKFRRKKYWRLFFRHCSADTSRRGKGQSIFSILHAWGEVGSLYENENLTFSLSRFYLKPNASSSSICGLDKRKNARGLCSLFSSSRLNATSAFEFEVYHVYQGFGLGCGGLI